MIEALKLLLSKIRLPDYSKVDEITSIEPYGRDEFRFKERDHVLIIYAEIMPGDPDRLIDRTSVDKWLPPNADEAITEADRERILGKFCKYLETRGLSYKFR